MKTRVAGTAAALAILAALPYLRSLTLPFISDDYLLLMQSRTWGPVDTWPQLAADGLYRTRAWSIVMHHWLEWCLGPWADATACRVFSLAWHIANTWLVALFGFSPRIGWRLSIVASAFFAVYEGHQEAIIWYSALPELQQTFFVLLTVLCWLKWLTRQERWPWLIAVYGFFLAGLAAKEPAVVSVALLAGAGRLARVPWNRLGVLLSPLAVATVVYIYLTFATPDHLHLSDGTFSLTAPFWKTWAISTLRMMWFWACWPLASFGPPERTTRTPWLVGAAWMAVTLTPFIFLTYMDRVPSRHTYLPSVGLSLLVGAGFISAAGWLERRRRRQWAVALGCLVVLHNVAYVWLVKHPQFERRALPTETLIEFARKTRQPFAVVQFPFSRNVITTTIDYAAPNAKPFYRQGVTADLGVLKVSVDEDGHLAVRE